MRLSGVIVVMLTLFTSPGWTEVCGHFVPQGKQVALTFDACETRTPSFFDAAIVEFITTERLPSTFFLSGWFAERNADQVQALSVLPFVSMENHSESHVPHMNKLSPEEIRAEVLTNETRLVRLTGKKPVFFRFPAGNYDDATLRVVESLGYTVAHWAFPSGDPDKRITPDALASGVLGRVKPGDILIFHVNGRGWSTGQALPVIVAELRRRGFSFVRLADIPHASFRP